MAQHFFRFRIRLLIQNRQHTFCTIELILFICGLGHAVGIYKDCITGVKHELSLPEGSILHGSYCQ